VLEIRPSSTLYATGSSVRKEPLVVGDRRRIVVSFLGLIRLAALGVAFISNSLPDEVQKGYDDTTSSGYPDTPTHRGATLTLPYSVDVNSLYVVDTYRDRGTTKARAGVVLSIGGVGVSGYKLFIINDLARQCRGSLRGAGRRG
jgi:hypothetical protein